MGKIAYIEIGVYGHQPVWMRSFLQAFTKLNESHDLTIWVPERFTQIHHVLCDQFNDNPHIHFRYCEEVITSPNQKTGMFKVIQACMRSEPADICFIGNNYGTFIKDLTFSFPGSIPTHIVGVMSQPYIHYIKFKSPATSHWLTPLRFIKRYLLLWLFSHRPEIPLVFMNDPLAPDFFRKWLMTGKYLYLPEYTQNIDQISEPRQYYKIPEGRIVFLLAGALNRHKGIFEFLDGVLQVNKNSKFHQQACVVLAGRVDPRIKQVVTEKVDKIKHEYPDFPIYLLDQWFSDPEFDGLISAADVICLPYLNVPATSGLLIQAASHGKLVCANDFGIVGELVRRYDLGIAYNQQNAESISIALTEAMSRSVTSNSAEQEKLKAFSDKFCLPIDRFGEFIFNSIVSKIK
jgi:glycosyltransferase involved in cell wall biosynthesis